MSHVYMSFNMAKAEEARKLVKKGSANKEGEHKVHTHVRTMHTHTHTWQHTHMAAQCTRTRELAS